MAKKAKVKAVAEIVTKQDLFDSLWHLSESLKGGNDAWDFKEYILCCLFYRFISEKITKYINDGENDDESNAFDYASISDDEADTARDEIVNEIGYFILPSDLFQNLVNNSESNENLNTQIVNAFRHIEASSKGYDDVPDCFDGLFSGFDVTSKVLGDTVREKNQKINAILLGIKNADFGKFIDEFPDIYGECFAYLIRQYAATIKKNPGDYFTPESLATLLGILATSHHTEIQKAYDGSCGSGSLLLEVAKNLGIQNVHIGLFGQDRDQTFYKLFRMNLLMHNIAYNKFDIACADTLTEPMHNDDTPFDIVISNMKFSESWVGDDDATLINDPRYSDAGILAPKGNADMAFVLHGLSYLAESGTAVMVCHPGILYRDHAEQKIREYLVRHNRIDAIIQLTSSFSKGGIGLAIMVLRKAKTDSSILFIDASNEFEKIGNVNVLSPDNIAHISYLYQNRIEESGISRLVSFDEIAGEKNNFTLSVGAYIEKLIEHNEIDISLLNQQVRDVSDRNFRLRDAVEHLIKEVDGDEQSE